MERSWARARIHFVTAHRPAGGGTGGAPRAVDPVCGMTVDPASAPSHAHAGQTYYFCCTGCQGRFRESPAAYLKLPAGAPPPARHHAAESAGLRQDGAPTSSRAWVCPMDPEVHKNAPGPCPRCGMALEPAAPSLAPVRTEWTCPMHPEIVRDRPGSCPICGMALEMRAVSASEEENPELRAMTRRFWVSLALTAPLMLTMLGDRLPGGLSHRAMAGAQLILA